MSNEAQAAFNIYFAQFDPEESEWLDRSTEQIFIDGFNAGSAENAALKEENERLSDGLSHHMNISQVLAEGNANMYEMVMERDAEIALLKAKVAELEAGAYESIMAFNATQDESLEAPELVDAVLAHAEAVRKLWNIWATRKGAEND